MNSTVLVDNDIAVKLCVYSCANEFYRFFAENDLSLSMLGVSFFSANDQVGRSQVDSGLRSPVENWEDLKQKVKPVEPTDREIEIAAELEDRAVNLSLELDEGESQLCAILICRSSPALLTGDKRAISALERLQVEAMRKRVGCLEQTLVSLTRALGSGVLRERICGSPKTDTAITNCFHCSSNPGVSEESVLEGLRSYIEHLRRRAPETMIPGDDLSAIIS